MEIQIIQDEKIAVLFGATGLVGGHCLDFLLASRAYSQVIVFGRRSLDQEHDKLTQHIVDFDQLTKHANLIKGNDLFCCLGTTMKKAGSKDAFRRVDYTYTHQIAEIAAKNKVNQLLLISSVGADKDSLFFYNRVKGELEEEIKRMPFWATHIFQPSVLIGDRNENRFGEELAGKIGSIIDRFTGGLLSKYRPVEADVVAKAMVVAAQGVKKGVQVYPSHVLQDLANNSDKLRLL